MQFGRAVRAALIAAAAMMATSMVAPKVALADHSHHHGGDLGWRCEHGDAYACRVLRDDWRYYRGGGPYYDYYYDRHGHLHHGYYYYDRHGHRHHY